LAQQVASYLLHVSIEGFVFAILVLSLEDGLISEGHGSEELPAVALVMSPLVLLVDALRWVHARTNFLHEVVQFGSTTSFFFSLLDLISILH
jgi:hypothetical protein